MSITYFFEDVSIQILCQNYQSFTTSGNKIKEFLYILNNDTDFTADLFYITIYKLNTSLTNIENTINNGTKFFSNSGIC